MSNDDLSTAENAYSILLVAQHEPRPAAADLVRALRVKTQNTGKHPREVEIVQADAWLAVCALSNSLDTKSETDIEDWARAMSRIEEWRNLLA